MNFSRKLGNLKIRINRLRRYIHKLQPTSPNHPATDIPVKPWDNNEHRPVAIIWNVPAKQQEQIKAYFSEYKVFCVLGQPNLFKIKRSIKDVPENHPMLFISYHLPLPLSVKKYAKKQKIKQYVLTKSLFQQFNNLKASMSLAPFILNQVEEGYKLNNLLKEYDFNQDEKSLKQAEKGIAILHAGKITNQYNLSEQVRFDKIDNEDYHILILGKKTSPNFFRKWIRCSKNNKLIYKVRKDYPDARLYFKTGEVTKKFVNSLEGICEVIDDTVDSFDILQRVDHVVTYDSDTGFDAILMGKKVTTYGKPFYAGFGITDDRHNKAAFVRTLSKEALFASSYLIAPSYAHPVSNEKTDFFNFISYFTVEKIKYRDLFDISSNLLDTVSLQPNVDLLSAPLELLLYLQKTEFHGSGRTDDIIAIATKKFNLADFTQFSHLLIKSANYDALASYCNYCLDYFKREISSLYHNHLLLNDFLYSLGVSLRNSRGRLISKTPNINKWIFSEVDASYLPHELITNYITCLSYNLQYNEIEESINKLHMYKDVQPNLYKKLCDILLGRPARSERNCVKRNILLRKIARLYKKSLDKKYQDSSDVFLNGALYYVCLDDETSVLKALETHQYIFNNKLGFSEKYPRKRELLSKRKSDFSIIFNYLLIKDNHDFAKKILENFKKFSHWSLIKSFSLKYEWSLGKLTNYQPYIRLYNQLGELKQKNTHLVTYANALANTGEFEIAKKILTEYKKKPNIISTQRENIENSIARIEFSIRAGEILNGYPQPKIPKGVIFISSQTCYDTMAMLIPCLREVKRRGYAVINLTQGMLPLSSTGIDYIDKYADAIPPSTYFPEIKQQWRIDWPARVVTSLGINFYQGFYEKLSCMHRRFNIDINEPQLYRDFLSALKRADTYLTICEGIYSDIVQKGIPVTFISGTTQIVPFSIARDYCRYKDHPLLSFVYVNIAYENYFSNLGSKYSHTMCVTDMTIHKNYRAPFLPRKDRFERWYQKNNENADFLSQANSLINVNRNSSENDTQEQKWIEFLKAQKSQNKKIICCFGKVPCDLAVPYDGGPAHKDMADWISHTIAICGQSDDICLLVKPHPHELRPEIALDLVEGFIDLIDVEIKPNVQLLKHRDINAHALAPYLDLAILWNGSAGLELTAQGVPVMMCAYFGRYDYPVDMMYPQSRSQYADYILNLNFEKPSRIIRKKAAFLICYMGTNDVAILNDYTLRPVTNDPIGIPKWQEEKISHFIEYGDPKMELAASRILEKFEGEDTLESNYEILEQTLNKSESSSDCHREKCL